MGKELARTAHRGLPGGRCRASPEHQAAATKRSAQSGATGEQPRPVPRPANRSWQPDTPKSRRTSLEFSSSTMPTPELRVLQSSSVSLGCLTSAVPTPPELQSQRIQEALLGGRLQRRSCRELAKLCAGGLPRKRSADSALPRSAASSHGPRPQPAPEATPPYCSPEATPPNPLQGSSLPSQLRQPTPPGATPAAHLPLDYAHSWCVCVCGG